MPRGDIIIRQWTVLKVLDESHFGMTLPELTASVRTELPSQSEVHERTIRRDLQVLKDDVGFPISVEHYLRRGTVYRLDRKCLPLARTEAGATAPTALTVSISELLALLAAREHVAASPRTPFGKAFDSFFTKARRAAPAQALRHFEELKSAIYIRPQPPSGRKGPDWTQKILQAIHLKRVLRIEYQAAAEDGPSTHLYEPLAIAKAAGAVYLIALRRDLRKLEGDEKASRHLKLDRIRALTMRTDRFVPPKGFDARSHLAGSMGIWQPGKPREYVLRATRLAARYVQESPWHETQKAKALPSGGIEFRLTLGDDHELTAKILSFEGNVTVVSPPGYRAQIAESLRRMAKAYG